MKRLHLDNTATRFIISDYEVPPKKPLHTPFGDATEVYVNKYLKPTKVSEIGSESYRVSLSRAFNRAKKQVFFNPDMTKFITLTYAENMTDPDKLLQDVKYLIQKQKRENNRVTPKYIYVIEEQKRGALHVHMIANDFLDTYKNKNGYDSVLYWEHGINTIHDVKDADSNFKSYLYLFKYMKKAQRIGASFVHASRNLKNYDELTDYEFDVKLHDHIMTEQTTLGYIDREITKKYYEKPKN